MADASKHRRGFPLMLAGGGYGTSRMSAAGKRSLSKRDGLRPFVTVLQHLGFELDRFATSRSNLNAALL